MALLRFKAAFVLLLLPIALSAQTNPQMADMNDTIEMMRSLAALERKAVIADSLGLSGEESNEFWQIYD